MHSPHFGCETTALPFQHGFRLDGDLSKLMAAQSSQYRSQEPLQLLPNFEHKRRAAQEGLRTFLLGVIDRCSQGWHVAHHLGFLPHTSIKNKFPYYKEAVAHPEVAARPSYRQAQAQALHAACAVHPPDISRIRARPKRARDAFGPGMVFVVNTVLAWLMFSIDVRNNMLR